MDLLTLAASTYSALQNKEVRKTVGALAAKARRTDAATVVRLRHEAAPHRDMYTRGKSTRDDRTVAQQQAFLKSARYPSSFQLQSSGFRSNDHYQANLKAAHRMLGQERGMRAEGEASTHGDTRELTKEMRDALNLEARTRQTEQQYQAQAVRQRRQGLNSTVEGQQSRYTTAQHAKDALVQTPAFLGGTAVGYAKAGVEFAHGLVQAARHPIQTGEAVVNAVAHPLQTAGNVARWGNEQSRKMDEALQRGDVYSFGKAYGHTSGTIVANAVGPKLVSRGLKVVSSPIGPLASAAATRFPALAPAIALANRAAVSSGNVLRAVANSKPGQVATHVWDVANKPFAMPNAIPAAIASAGTAGRAMVTKIVAPAVSVVRCVGQIPGKLWKVTRTTSVGKAIGRADDALIGANPNRKIGPGGEVDAAEARPKLGEDHTPGRGVQTEVYGPNVVKPESIIPEWKRFLGDGPYTNKHPRTGELDPSRLVSADGRRSIRYGNHERNSSAAKHHYHEETWTYDPDKHVMDCHNVVRRAPLNDTKSNAPKWPMED